MSNRPKLERLSWIAGIIGTAIAVATYLSTCTPRPPTSPSADSKSSAPLSSGQQQSGEGNVQIGSVSGDVVISPHAQSDSPRPTTSLLLSRRLPNIFMELGPGASVEKMKSLLGPPAAQGAAMSGAVRILQGFSAAVGDNTKFKQDPRRQYSYRFQDAHVQIRSRDGETISELMVITLDPKTPAHFKVARTEVVLGETLLGSLHEPTAPPKVDYSSKHHLTFVPWYGGAPGNYLYYYFGTIETYNSPAPEKEGLVNFAAVLFDRVEAPYFDWAHLQ